MRVADCLRGLPPHSSLVGSQADPRLLPRPQRENSSIISQDFYSRRCVNDEAAARSSSQMSNHRSYLGITTVIQAPENTSAGLYYRDLVVLGLRFLPGRENRQGEGAPWWAEGSLNTRTVLFWFPAMENKSVVLASTAIQLKDDRKSPIVAGKPQLMS